MYVTAETSNTVTIIDTTNLTVADTIMGVGGRAAIRSSRRTVIGHISQPRWDSRSPW